MVTHLSHPQNSSINFNIDLQYTSITYTSFNTVIQTISTYVKGTPLANEDIKKFTCFISWKIFETFYRSGHCLRFGASLSWWPFILMECKIKSLWTIGMNSFEMMCKEFWYTSQQGQKPCLMFLGLKSDTTDMHSRIPNHKVVTKSYETIGNYFVFL